MKRKKNKIKFSVESFDHCRHLPLSKHIPARGRGRSRTRQKTYNKSIPLIIWSMQCYFRRFYQTYFLPAFLFKLFKQTNERNEAQKMLSNASSGSYDLSEFNGFTEEHVRYVMSVAHLHVNCMLAPKTLPDLIREMKI